MSVTNVSTLSEFSDAFHCKFKRALSQFLFVITLKYCAKEKEVIPNGYFPKYSVIILKKK